MIYHPVVLHSLFAYLLALVLLDINDACVVFTLIFQEHV